MASTAVRNSGEETSQAGRRHRPPLTEKRRQQNRDSQRTYREKRKKLAQEAKLAAKSRPEPVVHCPRQLVAKPDSSSLTLAAENTTCSSELQLQSPEGLPQAQNLLSGAALSDVHEVDLTSYLPGFANDWVDDQNCRPTGGSNPWPQLGLTSNELAISSERPTDLTPLHDINWAAVDNFPSAFANTEFVNRTVYSPQSLPRALPVTNEDTNDSHLSKEPLLDLSEQFTMATPLVLEYGSTVATDDITNEPSTLSTLEPSTDWLGASSSTSSVSRADSPVTEILGQVGLDETEDNKRLFRTASKHEYNLVDIFQAGLQVLGRSSSPKPKQSGFSPILPDPYKNRLAVARITTLQAYLANAEALGYLIPELYCKISPSIFHHPKLKTATEINGFRDTISYRIPLHLRPMHAQIQYAHPPFMDLLPFPSVRERAVLFSSFTPPLIDVAELKADILNDGLICWTKSKKGTGQPWDMRSWEAAEWFLKKWWMLVGGEEDDIQEHTKWWRNLRGHDRSLVTRPAATY
ncbi:hypothetical protein OIDMADRAFT_58461 [Oidiodendron maius Zn]|uniref:BZIP domain-containing protein n=1 Tax=Oidiodendron maius (strain Zn) TaxID=913774 RepID=A0A0C3H0I9_OIDMZ|nr:hypothetical protein OIDMADRAFT_58461 [Oidiodendron maius Zn]